MLPQIYSRNILISAISLQSAKVKIPLIKIKSYARQASCKEIF